MSRSPKHLKDKKITVKHYLNKQLKPNKDTGRYPVYIRVRLDDKKSLIPSRAVRFGEEQPISGGDSMDDVNNNPQYKKQLENERQIIYDIIDFYRSKNINLIAEGSMPGQINLLSNSIFDIFSKQAVNEFSMKFSEASFELYYALNWDKLDFIDLFEGFKEICGPEFYNQYLKPFEGHYYILDKLRKKMDANGDMYLYQYIMDPGLALELVQLFETESSEEEVNHILVKINEAILFKLHQDDQKAGGYSLFDHFKDETFPNVKELLIQRK